MFSGSYTDLSNKPTGLGVLLNKPSIPGVQVQTDWNTSTGLGVLLNKPTIPTAQVQTDWNATTGLGQLLNKPTIPAAQVQTDWNTATGLGVLLNKPTIPAAPTSANLIGIFNTTQFTNNVGTSKIDIITTWKPTTTGVADTALKLASSKNIAGVGFDGSISITIPYFNLDNKITVGSGLAITTGSTILSPNLTLNLAVTDIPALTTSKITGLDTALSGKQATMNDTAGQLITGNGNGATTIRTGLTWTTVTNLLTATNISATAITASGLISANGGITIATGNT